MGISSVVPVFFISVHAGAYCRTNLNAFRACVRDPAIFLGGVTALAFILGLSAVCVTALQLLTKYGVPDSASRYYHGSLQLYGAAAFTLLGFSVLHIPQLRHQLLPKAKAAVNAVNAKAGDDAGAQRAGLFRAAVLQVLRYYGIRTVAYMLVLGFWGTLYPILFAIFAGFPVGVLCATLLNGDTKTVTTEEALAATVAHDSNAALSLTLAEGKAALDADPEMEEQSDNLSQDGDNFDGNNDDNRYSMGTLAVLTRVASERPRGVVSEQEEACVASMVWQSRRSRLIETLPLERRQAMAVAAVMSSRNLSASGDSGGIDDALLLALKSTPGASAAPGAAETGATVGARHAPTNTAAPTKVVNRAESESWHIITDSALTRPAAAASAVATAGAGHRSPVAVEEPRPRNSFTSDTGNGEFGAADAGATVGARHDPTSTAAPREVVNRAESESWHIITDSTLTRPAAAASAVATAGVDHRSPVAVEEPRPRNSFASDTGNGEFGGGLEGLEEGKEGEEEASASEASVKPRSVGAGTEPPAQTRASTVHVGSCCSSVCRSTSSFFAAALPVLGMLACMLVAASMTGNAATLLYGDSRQLWDNCDGTSAENFFTMLTKLFGYECQTTIAYVVGWCCYWGVVAICLLAAWGFGWWSWRSPEPVLTADGAGKKRAGSTKATFVIRDPAHVCYHPTAWPIRILALLNVATGVAYLWWRATSSMKDVGYPIWSWIFFGGECILVYGVFMSHFARIFPAVRERCTMDEMVAVDPDLSGEATVAILVPTAGEKLKGLKQAVLGAYSQRLWDASVSPSRQLRICVLDEKRRPEVLALVELVYKLAVALAEPAAQREIAEKLGDEWISPKMWMETYSQFRELDHFLFNADCADVFAASAGIEDLVSGASSNGRRHLSHVGSERPPEGYKRKGAVDAAAAGAANGASGANANNGSRAKETLEPGCLRLFADFEDVPSMAYYARKDSGMPSASPKAGNMNAAVFPAEVGAEAVIGAARIVKVNDARHRMRMECLQRTVPYFFRLVKDKKRVGKGKEGDRAAETRDIEAAGGAAKRASYEWGDVAFVQLPQRFEDLKDGDPLANHAVLTFFVANVAKDGLGAVTSCGQGGLWRVDALWGNDVKGKRSIQDPVEHPELIGHKCGFRAEVLIEDTHTSLSLFRLGWRSAYVCEAGEALAICVDPPNTAAWRVKQVFRWHLGAVQLLLKDGLSFVFAWRMPTFLHRLVALECITYYFQSLGGVLLVIMPVVFVATQEPPFQIHNVGFVAFFLPYLITATIPTILSTSWKDVYPDGVLTDEQFWLATCYVQFWSLVNGIKDRLVCADPKNAWTKQCPTWPLWLSMLALAGSTVATTVYWGVHHFHYAGAFTWFTSIGTCLVVMHSLWPMFQRWWKGVPKPGMPSVYCRKTGIVLLFVGLCGLLVIFVG